jgi:1-acyl-sn-glycerol-3-phosphate acyltransferase
MADDPLRRRVKENVPEDVTSVAEQTAGNAAEPHPAGEIKHGSAVEALRLLLFVTWFVCCAACINMTQLLGSPLYLFNKDYYYAYMALTKQSFGIFIATITQWFSPTVVRVSWDASVRGQLRKTSNGRLETNFPERLVLIANHQIYTDWLYLWWTAYTSRMHGHMYIILKESLKYIPLLSPGIMFYGFVFMSRKWDADKPRMQYRLQKLKSRHSGPLSGTSSLDPMWLMIFPEGTNLSRNTRKGSVKWAEKQGIPDLKHELLPRSTGLQFCLEELDDSVDWVYDCTIAYEGVPKGGYAPEYFTLRSTYLQGRPPKSVNMYWRRFATSNIPIKDPKAFETWVLDRWKEKDALLEKFYETGRFPSDQKSGDAYLETEVKLQHWLEVGQIFAVLAALAMVVNVLAKLWEMMIG